MKLTPRERQVLAHWLRGKMNKQIAYDLDLSPETVKVYLRRVYRKFGARHGREAWAYTLGNLVRKLEGSNGPEEDFGYLGEDIIDRMVAQLAGDQDNRPNSYTYKILDPEGLRGSNVSDPLSEVIRYYDGIGSSPGFANFPRETLAKFGHYTEPFHYVMDVNLKTKDNDISKFHPVRIGSSQPTTRQQQGRLDEMTPANQPSKLLAEEMSSRLALAALAHRISYRWAHLRHDGIEWEYRSLSLPLYDENGVCDKALVVFDSDKSYSV